MTVDVLTATAAGFSNEIPAVSWGQFIRSFEWRQGEHIGMIGPTGNGKTNLELLLLMQGFRDYVAVFATKVSDPTLDLFGKAFDFKKLAAWNPKLKIEKYPKRLLWPKGRDLRSLKQHQRDVFLDALDDIYAAGGWCIVLDEMWWIGKILGLEQEMKIILQQGRSAGLSFMGATQRPAWVPLEVYDNSTHLFFWADNDETNLKRISSIGSFNSLAIRARIATLDEFEVLYVNTRKKTMCTFRPPLLVLKGGKTE